MPHDERNAMPHEKMQKCFMNGMSCTYERIIGERIRCMAGRDHERRAFVIMPFAPDLDAIYQWQLVPFLNRGGLEEERDYRCSIVERADDVRQIGYVICEKICKKIQEADLVVVDLSFDNPNVFYEFGLAAALRKPILPICFDQRVNPERQKFLLHHFGVRKFITCPSFGYLNGKISDNLYRKDGTRPLDGWSGDRFTVVHDGSKLTIPYKNTQQGMEYSFGKICVTATATALNEIFSEANLKAKPELKYYKTADEHEEQDEKFHPYVTPYELDVHLADFDKVVARLKKSYCASFDVRSQHPAILFWLGYSHGLGEFAIPVNEVSQTPHDPGSDITPAFDIVALWHAFFERTHPLLLSKSIRDILEFVLIEKSRKIQRTQFWKEMLASNEVSIFLGSLTVEELGRNTLGDWDYRTAAELTSFLTAEKETMEVTLESPIPKSSGREADEEWLTRQLKDKNCIIVASPDVNDLTEVVLATLHGAKPFCPIDDTDPDFDGYIAYKRYAYKHTLQTTMLTRNVDFASLRLLVDKGNQGDENQSDERGFVYRQGDSSSERLISEPHLFPDEGDGVVHKLLGLLVVAPNPFVTSTNSKRRVIVIDGISGPATLGIAQLLTGCKYQDFTVNRLRISDHEQKSRIRDMLTKAAESFSLSLGSESPPDEESVISVPYDQISEECLAQINNLLSGHTDAGIEALVSVSVYYPKSGEKQRADERKILAWQFYPVRTRARVGIPNPRIRPAVIKAADGEAVKKAAE